MKKKSFVWDHFTMAVQGNRATCHHCKKDFSYSLTTMSNLGRHIKVKHPEAIVGDSAVDESAMEVYAVEEVEHVSSVGELANSYEITMKGFEEMEDISTTEDARDPEWTPETGETCKDQPTPTAGTSFLKKPRKSSAVWNHFQRSSCKTNATCLHCGRTIKMGTISNLARHLRHKHPNKSIVQTHEYASSLKPSYDINKIDEKDNSRDEQSLLKNELDICSEVIELNVDNLQNPGHVIETKVDASKNVDISDVDVGIITQSSQTESCNITEDFDMHDYIKPKETYVASETVDYKLVMMIVKGCHPVTMVEQSGFKEFVKVLNPKYQLPSLNKLTKELIPKYYRQCETRASKSLKEAEGICLYIDQIKSRNVSYMCVTAHFINQECKFERLFLACHVVNSNENSTDISQRLLETVTEWEIADKVVAAVTDNTEIITDAVKLHSWGHIPHFIRSLCVIVYESLQVIKSIIHKVKIITEELRKSPQVIAEIYSNHKMNGFPPVKLITKVRNDRNSSFTTLEMLSRFSKLRLAITHVSDFVPECKLTENDWKILKHVIDDVLRFFKEVKQEVTKEERVCMSKIVFYINSLKSEMNKLQSQVNTLPSDPICVATTADTFLEKLFRDFLDSELVSFILLLDPRLKKFGFHDESEYAAACSKLKREVCQLSETESEYNEPNEESLWFSFDQEVRKLNAVKDPIGKGILELENYLQEQLLGREQDPLQWWEQRKAIYPRLFKLMKKYLCVSAKAGQRESISFKTAYMLSQLRNCDCPALESELMFLHHNM